MPCAGGKRRRISCQNGRGEKRGSDSGSVTLGLALCNVRDEHRVRDLKHNARVAYANLKLRLVMRPNVTHPRLYDHNPPMFILLLTFLPHTHEHYSLIFDLGLIE